MRLRAGIFTQMCGGLLYTNKVCLGRLFSFYTRLIPRNDIFLSLTQFIY
ncbi:hypothetical protein NIES4073_19910 [Kalymmatonema gypsitolerans NIES-4073]|nr:hypothetical protein NIES4073_19910 [Scytonema sp. NIES-4073]